MLDSIQYSESKSILDKIKDYIKAIVVNFIKSAGIKITDGMALEASINSVMDVLQSVNTENSSNTETKLSKPITISKTPYTKETPNDKTKGFFFTENLQAYLYVRGRSNEVDLPTPLYGMKLNVIAKNNQAGIRYNINGRNKNSFAIISKKFQQDDKGYFVKENGQFQDTDSDFELFKKYNTEAIQEAINSKLPLTILESGIATGKSALPLRFAEWLNTELSNKLGVFGTIKENNTIGYKGYGIFNIIPTTNQTSLFDPNKQFDILANTESIKTVFEQNPELATIGTPEQYSQYLDTIFPDSKVKDIVYHGTTATFDTFDKSFIKRDGVNSFGDKFYFSPNTPIKIEKNQRNIPVLLNILQYEDFFEQGTYETSNNIRRFEEGVLEELAVNEPEQIHILGSKQDIQGFKDFINNTTTIDYSDNAFNNC